MKTHPGNGLTCHIFLPNVVCITNYRRNKSEQPLENMSEITLTDGTTLIVTGNCDDLALDLKYEWQWTHGDKL